MASIYTQTKKSGTYYYLKEDRNTKPLYLGTKPPIAKSRGWTNLSPKVVEWLKQRTQQKTKPIPISPSQNGKYRTIVVDPPWPMERTAISMLTLTQAMPFDYPTMTVSQIKNDRKCVPIRKLMDKSGCFVFLWTTQRFLHDAFDCLLTWGLHPIFTMVWVKGKGKGMQIVNRPKYNCEFVVVGCKAMINFADIKAFDTAFDAPRREHSRKPKEFYQLLQRVSPAPRIDMFSREKHKGFDQFGNEEGKFS